MREFVITLADRWLGRVQIARELSEEPLFHALRRPTDDSQLASIAHLLHCSVRKLRPHGVSEETVLGDQQAAVCARRPGSAKPDRREIDLVVSGEYVGDQSNIVFTVCQYVVIINRSGSLTLILPTDVVESLA